MHNKIPKLLTPTQQYNTTVYAKNIRGESGTPLAALIAFRIVLTNQKNKVKCTLEVVSHLPDYDRENEGAERK
jgi:hypothetical protein